MLTARNVAGEKQRLHNHFLKGTVRCGGCGSRLCITQVTNRWGTTYVYFLCLGRQQKRTGCVRKSVSVELIEDKVDELWDQVRISPDYAELLDKLIRSELAVYREQAERTRASATRKLQLLQGQRRKLLDAHYAGAIPVDLRKTEQDRLTTDIQACERRLAKAGSTSEAIEQNLAECLRFVQEAATAYRVAPARVRRRMNQALFERIVVEEGGEVVGHLAGPYRQLLDPAFVLPADHLADDPAPDEARSEGLTGPQQEVYSTRQLGAWACQRGCTAR